MNCCIGLVNCSNSEQQMDLGVEALLAHTMELKSHIGNQCYCTIAPPTIHKQKAGAIWNFLDFQPCLGRPHTACSPHAGHTSVSHLQVELSARMLFADGFSSSPLRSVFLLFSKCRASIQLTAAHSFSTCYSHDQPLLRYRPGRGLSETIFKR